MTAKARAAPLPQTVLAENGLFCIYGGKLGTVKRRCLGFSR